MIKRFSFIAVIISAFIMINSCKNDFDILAPYKDTTIVYGLLNPSDSVQYIRIHKAYLGEGNAYQFAGIADSFYYGDVLNVKLERWVNNTLKGTIDFVRDSSTIVKDPGTFANYPNILYKSVGSDSIYNNYNTNTGEHSIYKLYIENKQTGRLITSQTPVVSKIFIGSPVGSIPINFVEDPFVIKWLPAYFGKIYEVVVRFHYSEQSKSDPTQVAVKYVDWNLGQKIFNGGNITSPMQIDIGKDDFFVFLASQIPVNPDLKRLAGKVDFIFTAGADDFYTYYKINAFPTGLSQNIPDYTNITGGLGIFSSRYIQVLKDRDLDNNTLSELVNGVYTKDLNF